MTCAVEACEGDGERGLGVFAASGDFYGLKMPKSAFPCSAVKLHPANKIASLPDFLELQHGTSSQTFRIIFLLFFEPILEIIFWMNLCRRIYLTWLL